MLSIKSTPAWFKFPKTIETFARIDLETKFSISSRTKDNKYSVACLSGKEVNRYVVNNYYYIVPTLEGIDYKSDIFSNENLLVKRIATKPEATIIESETLSFNTLYSIYDLKFNSKKSLLIILNSKLIHFYYELVFNLGMNLTTQITVEYLKQIPVPKIENQDQANFLESIKNAIGDVSSSQKKSAELTKQFELGIENDLTKVMINQQLASIGFQMTLNVRNKVLSAYKDIMNMPV